MEELPVWLIALIFVLFVLLPIGFIWSGVKLVFINIRLGRQTQRVIGKVIETDHGLPPLQQMPAAKCWLLFEYSSPQGELLQGEAVTVKRKDNFALHSEHEILVNFDKPGTVYLPQDRSYLKALAMIVIGCAVLFAGGSFMLLLN